MRYLLLLIILLTGFYTKAQNNWDKKITAKNVKINVEVNDVVASTTYEIEFANAQNAVVEGLFTFTLKTYQVVSAMQLDLDGHFREATIEEKWKATNAYREIVGKRIDPALLTKDYNNNYRLNIFPMPAKGTRKIRFTIDETLPVKDGRVVYSLPISITDKVLSGVVNFSIPNSTQAIFSPDYTLNANQQIVFNDSAISGKDIFSMHVDDLSFFESAGNFIGRYVRSEQQLKLGKVDKLLIFWDVSLSMYKRNIDKEIKYLQAFVEKVDAESIHIVTFSESVNEQKIFSKPAKNLKALRKYLLNRSYDGATSFNAINSTYHNADYTLLFSDGHTSLGGDIKPFNGNIRAIASSRSNNTENLRKITNYTKDAVVNIAYTDIDNIAMSHELYYANLVLPDTYNIKAVINNLVYFTIENKKAILSGKYSVIQHEAVYKKLNTIVELSSLLENGGEYFNYKKLLKFGIDYKIVTPHTAFIVLERLEDYIKYDIAVPSDMYEAAEKAGYTNTQDKYFHIEQAEKLKRLNSVIGAFNKQYNKSMPVVDVLPDMLKSTTKNEQGDNNVNGNQVAIRGLSGRISGLHISNDLEESVVVTSLKSTMSSVTITRRNENILTGAQTIEQVLQGRVAGVHISGADAGLLSNAKVRIRGANVDPLWVLDNVPVEGNINQIVTLQDVEYIQILKTPSETWMWGSRGAGGVIVVVTKKGKSRDDFNPRPYVLSDMEDVEYMLELKSASDKLNTYQRLKREYIDNVSFYIDVASYFNSIGLEEQAHKIILNAIEVGNNESVRIAVAQIFEEWGEFEKAIEMYSLVKDYNVSVQRQIAWCYYRMGNANTAMQILYDLVTEERWPNEKTDNRVVIFQDLMGMMSLNNQVNPEINFAIPDVKADLRVVVTTDEMVESVLIQSPENKQFKKIENASGANYKGGELLCDYILPTAKKGTYKLRIKLSYYSYLFNYNSSGITPRIVKVLIFRNYGKPSQTVEQQNVVIDNQNGEFEILRFNWF